MGKLNQSEFSKVLRNYIKNWKLFVLSFVLCGAVAVAYLLIKNPEFQISANILIKEDNKSGMGGMASAMMKNFAFSDIVGNVGGGVVDDELEVISSYTLRYNTVKRLQLNKTFVEGVLKKKYYYNDSPIDVNPADAAMADTLARAVVFKISVPKKNENTVKVVAEYNGDEVGSVQGEFPATVKTVFGDFVVSKTEHYEAGKGLKMKAVFCGYGYSAEMLGRQVTIKLASKKANVINLIMEDINKQKGKDVLNTIIDEYNRYGIEEKNSTAERTALFLQKRIDLMDSELKGVERALEDYKTKNKLTDIESEAKIILEKSSDFKEKLINAETQYSVISVIEDFLRAPENRYAVVPMSLGIEEKSAVESLLSYNELLLERLKLLRSTNPGNPMIESMNEQVDATRQSVLVTIQSIKRGIEYARNDLRMQEEAFMNRIAGMPTQEREFIEIKRQQEIKQALFLFLLQKQEENAMNLASANPKAQIIDSAFVATKPVSPVKLFVVALWGIFGLMLPVGYLYGRKFVDPRLYTEDDLTALSGLPVMGRIRNGAKGGIVAADKSQVAEDIRSLRSTIFSIFNRDISGKSILVASMNDGEGRTFVASNLALSVALSGRKVLYVDADFRSSGAERPLSGGSRAGLYDLIADSSMKLSQAVSASSLSDNLFVLPCGNVGDAPSEMLQNKRFEELFREFVTEYDMVIVDSSAMEKYSDAVPVAGMVTSVLFVAREGHSQKHSVEYISSVVELTGVKNAACIMNGIKS